MEGTSPRFRQVCAIARAVITEHPTEDTASRLEAIKLRHLTLGFRYDPEQIHRALRALTDPARQWDHTNRRSARST